MTELVLPQEKRFRADVRPSGRPPFDATRLVGTQMPRLLQRFYPDLLWRVPTRRRVAYLTFDDGPTPELSGHLLDLLARYEAKATFFLVGSRAERDAGLVRAMVEGGHAVGKPHLHPPRRVAGAAGAGAARAGADDDLARGADAGARPLDAPAVWPVHPRDALVVLWPAASA